MTDTLATKEHPAPLDAFETAKPDEPLFTLQGGDPLAAPLVRLWAYLARLRTGVALLNGLALRLVELQDAVKEHDLADNERERGNLLVRATAAEEVSWAMDDYVKGHVGADVPSEATDTHLTELQRIDLHDARVRLASRVSGFAGELNEIRTALIKRSFIAPDDPLDTQMRDASETLREINQAIEPRRLFRKDT